MRVLRRVLFTQRVGYQSQKLISAVVFAARRTLLGVEKKEWKFFLAAAGPALPM